MTSHADNVHHRHSIRPAGYDYSKPGAYFIPLSRDVNTPQLAVQFLGVAILDTARLAAR